MLTSKITFFLLSSVHEQHIAKKLLRHCTDSLGTMNGLPPRPPVFAGMQVYCLGLHWMVRTWLQPQQPQLMHLKLLLLLRTSNYVVSESFLLPVKRVSSSCSSLLAVHGRRCEWHEWDDDGKYHCLVSCPGSSVCLPCERNAHTGFWSGQSLRCTVRCLTKHCTSLEVLV